MGMTVVGLALLGISIVLTVMRLLGAGDVQSLAQAAFPVLSGFSLGAPP
jgi:Na+/H+-translocating membrane pyrophosphatase